MKTQGLSYQEIVEEHLSTNPSLETSKSSVELEKAIRSESFSVKNEKTGFSSVRGSGAVGEKTNSGSDSDCGEKLVKAGADKKFSDPAESQHHLSAGVDVGDVDLARPEQTFTSSMTSHVTTFEQRQIKISGLNRREEWIQEQLEQQGSQTVSQTAGGVTTSTTTNYENSHSNQQSTIKEDSGATNHNINVDNINSNVNKDNSVSSDQSEHSSEMVVVAAVEKTEVEDEMSDLSTDKEKETTAAPDIRTSVVSGQFDYKDFLSGVEDITARGEREEEVVGLTSTPRESVRGRGEGGAGVSTSPRESTSSSVMSNEEIVRSHLTRFNQVNKTEDLLSQTKSELAQGAGEQGGSVRAQERRGQYNSVTEKYVNTAVREEDYQHQATTEVTEAALVSHTELMRELYSSGGQRTAGAADNTGQHCQPHKVEQQQHQAEPVAQHHQHLQRQDINTSTSEQERTVEGVGEEVGGLDEGKVRKKYIITQQEIVFYIKNAEGKIHIVHRPLITGEKIYGSLRKRNASQPNLTDVEKLDPPGAGLGHIRDVGNINLNPEDIKQPGHQQLLQQDNQWTSSGSIFDCNQGCFSDQTVII